MKNLLVFWRIRQCRLTKRVESARNRSVKLGAKGCFTKKFVENLYVKQFGRCACCGELLEGVYEIDHIIPLSRGGSNFPDNIQLLKPTCNRLKGSKIVLKSDMKDEKN